MSSLGHALGETGDGHWPVGIAIGAHHVLADEPPPEGGDTGPSPYSLVMAGLAACTAMTLRMYAERKGWEIGQVAVDCRMEEGEGGDQRVERVITLTGEVDGEQRARLAEIADRTPVTKTLLRAVDITTTLP